MDTLIFKLVGERIRSLRDVKSWTQADLSHKVNLTRSSIANIESGRQKIQLDSLYQIALALEVDIGSILPSTKELTSHLNLQIEETTKEKYSAEQIQWLTKVITKGKTNEG